MGSTIHIANSKQMISLTDLVGTLELEQSLFCELINFFPPNRQIMHINNNNNQILIHAQQILLVFSVFCICFQYQISFSHTCLIELVQPAPFAI